MKIWSHKINISVIELEKELNAFEIQGYTIYKLWKVGYDTYEIVAYSDDVKAGNGRRKGSGPLNAKDFPPQEANMI
jgi:murein L,D-transpeptidase YafK